MKSIYGHLAALLVVAVWGTTFVSSKVLLNEGLMPADIFFARFLIAYLCMLAVSHKQFRTGTPIDELCMVGLGLMGGSLYFLTENMALMYSTSSNVSILVSTTPLLTTLILSMFYKTERMSRRQVVGSFIAFTGTVLVVLNGQYVLHLNPIGDTLALTASLTWAIYSLLMRRVMNRYPTDVITRKVFGYGILTILPYYVFVEPLHTDWHLWTRPSVVMNIVFLGFIASTCCYLLWNWVMKVVGAVKSTNYIYFQTLVTMLAGAIVLGERITLFGFAGAIVLILGMVLALRMSRKAVVK